MQYRPYRYQTDTTVSVRYQTQSITAQVLDVSRTGARLGDIQGLMRGDRVQVQVLTHFVDAVVVWARGGQMGIIFRPALDDHLVDILRKRCDGRAQFHSPRVGFRAAEMR
ncbi:PilZ domain-containing protein [Yoonia sp.]|uniref:PilZ domain-containing protein n=1 Tax=Yoonia sp. TaxID=2212373 RepID=UPI002FD9CCCA